MGVRQLVLLIRGDLISFIKNNKQQQQPVKCGEGMKKECSLSNEKRLCFSGHLAAVESLVN